MHAIIAVRQVWAISEIPRSASQRSRPAALKRFWVRNWLGAGSKKRWMKRANFAGVNPARCAGTGRLMTRWAEYPRPQMVRGEWRRLNGLWDYAVTGQGVEWKKPSVGLFESVA